MRKLLTHLPGQSLHIGVGARSLSLLWSNRLGGTKAEVLGEQSWTPEGDVPHACAAIEAALRELLHGHIALRKLNHWPVGVVIADELVRLWQVDPPRQATRLADLKGAAAQRFASLYGESPAKWVMAADWTAREPFMSAAIPRALLAALGAVTKESGLTLVQVQPYFVAVWNRWRSAIKLGAWFGTLHDGVLTLAVIDGRRLLSVRSLTPPGAQRLRAEGVAPPLAVWLAATLGREALLAGLDRPAQLQLCGQVPPELHGAALGTTQCVVLRVASPASERWSSASLLALGGRPA